MNRTDQYCPVCGYDNFFPGNVRKYHYLLYTFNGLAERCDNCSWYHCGGSRGKALDKYKEKWNDMKKTEKAYDRGD